MIEALIEQVGEGAVSVVGGLLLGVIFGALAQRSRFCMRSAVVDTVHGHAGPRMALWLLALGVAIAAVQASILGGYVDPQTVRLINGGGSLSGAAIGGLLFGAGMILARGCVSRLIVLSSAGNFRAVVTGLLFVLVAYATMKGPLTGLRDVFAKIAPIDGAPAMNLLTTLGMGQAAGIGVGLVVAALALVMGVRHGLGAYRIFAGIAIGIAVALAYAFTAALNGASFDPQPVRGLSFIAPSVNALSSITGLGAFKLDFDLGLVPGVIIGGFLAALIARDLKFEWFNNAAHSIRYIAGASLMGFGGVLATGCSMGNGLTGISVFSTTAAVALAAMWVGAGLTDAVVDRQNHPALTPATPLATPAKA